MNDINSTRSELDKIIHKRLEDVLVSAYLHVPYYRELMQAVDYNPVRDYRGPEDLALLPITSKEIIKKSGPRTFVAENGDLSTCFIKTTSGSTGIPLRMYRSPYEHSIEIAKWLRVLFINNYSIRYKVMSLSRPSRLSKGFGIFQSIGLLRRRVADFLLRPRQLVDIFLDYQPDVLYGHQIILDLMALELKKRKIRNRNLKLLIGTGNIIDDRSRRFCRAHFGVDLVESYGSEEMGVMAYETPARNGLHLCEDLTYFEFLDEEGEPVSPGEPGRVVVTDLTGKLMPLIRYDQGDLVIFVHKADKNGSGQHRLTHIIGRDVDLMVHLDGSRQDPGIFYKILGSYEDIFQYRVIQKTPGLFQILVVAQTSYLRNINDDLVRELQGAFPPEVRFEITQVPKMGPNPSGKLSMFFSEIEA